MFCFDQFILWAYGVYSVTCLAVVGIGTLPLLLFPLKLDTRRKVTSAAARMVFAITGIKVNVMNKENLPSTPCVAVANHASYLDGILLHAYLPTRFGFVIKREITKAPFIHFLLRRIGAYFVERHDQHRGGVDTRKILNHAKSGGSMVVFPEGTFARREGLSAFRSGAFAAAVAGNAPVVPIVIRGSRFVLPAERWWPQRGPIEIEILRPIDCPTEGGRTAMRSLADSSRAAILNHLDEPDLQNPRKS